MHIITNILEPNRLVLCWQPMSDDLNRTRRIIGEIIRQPDNCTLRYLVNTQDYRYALEAGLQLYPAFRDPSHEYSSGVLETFMLRLPPRKRDDFKSFLNSLRLPSDVNISDFALLGYSEARLPGDGFSVVNPLDGAPVPCQFLSEIAGFRHHLGPSMDIEVGEVVTYEAEPDNPHDPMAIKILVRGQLLGYVNRCQTSAFHQWIANNKLHGFVEKKNGTNDKPRLLLFVEVS